MRDAPAVHEFHESAQEERPPAKAEDKQKIVRTEIAGVLPEWPIGRINVRRRKSLDHDFSVRRDHDAFAMQHRRHHPQRLAEHAARRSPVALRIAQLRLSAEQRRGMMSDPESHRAWLPTRPELVQIAGVVCRGIGKIGHPMRRLHPAALDGRIVDSGIRIEGRRMRRREIRARFEFVLSQHREAREVGLGTMPDALLHRRVVLRDHDGVYAVRSASSEPRCRRAMVGDAERPGGQFPAGGEVGDDGDVGRATRDIPQSTGVQHGKPPVTIQFVLQGREPVARIDAGIEVPDCLRRIHEERPKIPHRTPSRGLRMALKNIIVT